MNRIDVEALLDGRAEMPLREMAPAMGLTPKAALLRRDRGTLPVRVHQERRGTAGRRGTPPMVAAAEVRRYFAERENPGEICLTQIEPGRQVLLALTADAHGRITLTTA